MQNPIRQYIKAVAKQQNLSVKQTTAADKCSLRIARNADGSVIFDKTVEGRRPEQAWETLWIWAWHEFERATGTSLYNVMKGTGVWH